MPPVRLFKREEVERQLWARHCRMVRDYETAALWRTQEGFHFTVPFEGPDRMCDEYTLREILNELDERGCGLPRKP